MGTNSHDIEMLLGDKRIPATIFEEYLENEIPDKGHCKLTIKIGKKSLSVVADNYFEALIRIREKLEPQGVYLNIYGASLNVWPSGMAVSMSLGTKAYKYVENGHPVVGIFETGDDVIPSRIADQREFCSRPLKERYIKSQPKGAIKESVKDLEISLPIEATTYNLFDTRESDLKKTIEEKEAGLTALYLIGSFIAVLSIGIFFEKQSINWVKWIGILLWIIGVIIFFNRKDSPKGTIEASSKAALTITKWIAGLFLIGCFAQFFPSCSSDLEDPTNEGIYDRR